MVFAAGALPASALDPIVYYVLERGMIEPLDRMVAQLTTGRSRPAIRSTRSRRLRRRLDGAAARRPAARRRRRGVRRLRDRHARAAAGPARRATARNALQGIGFYRRAWRCMPTRRSRRPTRAGGRSSTPGSKARTARRRCGSTRCSAVNRLWKSWITHRAPPQQVLASADFLHVVPSPDGIRAQRLLATQQGRGGLWYAGGYTLPFDSQETALLVGADRGRGPGGRQRAHAAAAASSGADFSA